MIHMSSNQKLAVTAATLGAELQSLHSLGGPADGWLWNGDPAVWGRRAPVCFPWCGRVKDGYFEEAGTSFQAPIHGLVRDLEHSLVDTAPHRLAFSLQWPGDQVSWPWPFRFDTLHTLEEDALVTTCTAVNTGNLPMPVQLGFHTALRCPFDCQHTPEDYLLRFQRAESPQEVVCDENGLVTGLRRPIFLGQDTIPLHTHLFDCDSICLTGLTSDWVQLEERATGRALRLELTGYPYILLWSMPGLPGFLCIEPWTGLPSARDGGHSLWNRPGVITLAPGAVPSRTQRITLI